MAEKAATRERLGLVLSLPDLKATVAAATAAERAGFESVWTTEFPDRSATISFAAVAGATERITVGTAIAYAFGRTPVVLAAEARDMDFLADGRLILGLGTGTRRMQQDWHGLDGEAPAPRIEELIPLLRDLINLDRAPVDHLGRFYRTVVNPTAPVLPPRRRDLPIYLGGVNPRMIEAAGAVGDGLIGHPLFTRSYTEQVVRPALARGAERAGRPAPPIAGYLTCAVDPDRETGRNNARAIVAFNSTVKTYRVIHRHHGFEDRAQAIREAWSEGDWARMVDGVDDEMLDTVALAGTAEEVRERFAGERSGLFEQTLLWPPAHLGLPGALAVIGAFSG